MLRPPQLLDNLSRLGQFSIVMDTAPPLRAVSKSAAVTGSPASGKRWWQQSQPGGQGEQRNQVAGADLGPGLPAPHRAVVDLQFPRQPPPGEPGGLPEGVQPVGEGLRGKPPARCGRRTADDVPSFNPVWPPEPGLPFPPGSLRWLGPGGSRSFSPPRSFTPSREARPRQVNPETRAKSSL